MGVGQGDHPKPPLGGSYPPVQFTQTQAALLESLADAMIPCGPGSLPPSEVDVVGFIGRYTTPRGEPPKWYPYLTEDELKQVLDELASEPATTGRDAGQVLAEMELTNPVFFALLQDVIYFAYYSRPVVTRAINETIPAGRDYRSSPQPYGYLEGLEEWDHHPLVRVRGSYIATEQVKRLDRLPDYDARRPAPGARRGTANRDPDVPYPRRGSECPLMAANTEADVLVVGAGPGGAAVSKRLCDGGVKVVCLEQGDWVHALEYPHFHHEWEIEKRRGWSHDPNARQLAQDYPTTGNSPPLCSGSTRPGPSMAANPSSPTCRWSPGRC